MTTTASIRPAADADAEDIAHVGNQLGYALASPETVGRIRRTLSKNDQRIYVVEAGGKVVGWVQVILTEHIEAAAFAIIGGLVVSREHRRQGLARSLMLQAEQWASEKGCSVVRLNSSSTRTGAHAFYEKIGYERIKTQYSFAKALGAAGQESVGKFVPRVDDQR
jgi:ribosomal protein S18 acetylase RimI-like enzyme